MSKYEYEDNPAMEHEVYSSEEEGVAFLGEFCPAFANATTTLHSITHPRGISLSANGATPLPTLHSATPSFMAIPKATPLATVSTLLPIFNTPMHLTTTPKSRNLVQRSKIRTTTTTPPPYLPTPPQLCFANPDVQLKKKNNKRKKFDTPPPSCESKLSFHCTTTTTLPYPTTPSLPLYSTATTTTPPLLHFTTPTAEPLLELPYNVTRLTQEPKRVRNNVNRPQNNKRKRLGFVPKPIPRSKTKSSNKIRSSKTVPIGSSSSVPQDSLDLDRDLNQLGTLLDDLDFDDQTQFDDILGSGGGERVENDLQSMRVDSLFQPSSSTTTEDADPENGSYILYEETLDISQQPETLQCACSTTNSTTNSISSPYCPIHKIGGHRILEHPPEPDLYWQSKWNFDYFHDYNYFENKEISTEIDFADSFIYYEVTKLFTEDLINRCLS